MLYLGTNSPHIALRSGDWVFMPVQGSFGLTTAPGSPWLDLAELGQSHSDYDEHGKLLEDAPPIQLYNLQEDPLQRVNLFRKYAERAAQLEKRHQELFRKLL